MAKQIIFRGSKLGACMRELTLPYIRDDYIRSTIPHNKRLFLYMGHTAQSALAHVLEEENFSIESEEKELTYKGKGYNIVGHSDIILDKVFYGQTVLLEVKCITNKWWNKVIKNGWIETYPKYLAQAQGYFFMSKTDMCSMVFINRDNGEAFWGLGAIPWNEDASFVCSHDPTLFVSDPYIDTERLELAVDIIHSGKEPVCDNEGFCFFCREHGSGQITTKRGTTLTDEGRKSLKDRARQAVRNSG